MLVLRGGPDATGDLLVAATARLDSAVLDVDLRVDRFSVDVTRSGAQVRLNGEVVHPTVVINRTGINGLGLSSTDGLARQRSSSWHERHTEGREEQGVMLAVFEAWQTQGVTVLNDPRATDLTLMPNAVSDRIGRAGGAFRASPPAEGDVSVLLCRGTGITASAQAGSEHLDLARRVAVAAEFELGSARIRPGKQLVACAWTPFPTLEEWDEPELLALSIMVEATGADLETLEPSPPRYFVPDLGRERPR